MNDERTYSPDELEHKLAEALKETTLARTRQQAVAQILRVLVEEPEDLARALRAIAESAAKLCNAFDAVIFLKRDNKLAVEAHCGPIPMDFRELAVNRNSISGRSVINCRTVHVADLQAEVDDFLVSASLSDGASYVAFINSETAQLSPDGKLAVTFSESGNTLTFRDMDGSRVVHIRLETEISPSGLAWLDDSTVSVLSAHGGALGFYDTNGRALRSLAIPAINSGKAEMAGEVAFSPDGEHMVISFGAAVHFLTTDGQVLGSWLPEPNSDQLLVQPTFTPDSRQVAFKLVETGDDEATGEEWSATTAIVFFTPEGQELFRVPVPRIPPEERPAQPALSDEPSAESAPATEETQQ